MLLKESSVNGLTKREYFAAMAMQGMLANQELITIMCEQLPSDQLADFIGKAATIQAEKLIEALNNRK